jgi:trans-2-enoyl-CoA reductase
MKINWEKLAARIPKKFKAGKHTFKVIWLDKFDDKKQVGMSDWNNKCIYIKKKQSKKELVHTYFHECLHIFSDEFELKISEKQVGGLEKTLQYWILYGNIFK